MEARTRPQANDPIEGLTVGAFATIGLVECPADAPLDEVASLMATHLVHAVVVEGDEGRGVIADSDLISAVASGEFEHLSAGDVAGSELVGVTCDETLTRATQLMAEHGLTHLVVLGENGLPIGVISTIDVARAISLRV